METATDTQPEPAPAPVVTAPAEEKSVFNIVVPGIAALAILAIVVLLVVGSGFSDPPELRDTPPPDATGLISLESVSQTLAGSITDASRPDRYALQLDGGIQVLVRMNAVAGERSGFDSELEVLGPDGESIAYNDDIGGEFGGGFGLDSQVVFVSDLAGQHIIEARALGGCCVGDYTLTIEFDGAIVPVGERPPRILETQ